MAVIRVPKLWAAAPRAGTATAVKLVADSEGLDAFGSESEPRPAAVDGAPRASASEPPPQADVIPRKQAPSRQLTGGAAVRWTLVFVLGASLAGAATWQYRRFVSVPQPGSLAIQTTPAGLDVLIGGVFSGRTPLSVSLPPGPHLVQVGSGGERRDLEINMTSGATIQHNLEIASLATAAAPAAVGALHIQTDIPAMTVTVDNVERGTSPLTVANLSPGDHRVIARGGQQTFRRTVSIKAGETMSLVISPIASNVAAPGWLAVSSPVVMQLREAGQLIGTTEAEKLMLASGDHDIEIVNDALGYKASRRITVAAGKVTTTAVELPSGLLSINAQPWAEVWVDGERIGQTPIANIPARLGSHDVVLRHPQLGERRQTVLVTLREPARLGVDLRR